MTLKEWHTREGHGSLTRLQLATGIAYSTLSNIANGKQAGKYDTAKKISDATGGAVTVAEVCESKPRRKSRRAPRAEA